MDTTNTLPTNYSVNDCLLVQQYVMQTAHKIRAEQGKKLLTSENLTDAYRRVAEMFGYSVPEVIAMYKIASGEGRRRGVAAKQRVHGNGRLVSSQRSALLSSERMTIEQDEVAARQNTVWNDLLRELGRLNKREIILLTWASKEDLEMALKLLPHVARRLRWKAAVIPGQRGKHSFTAEVNGITLKIARYG